MFNWKRYINSKEKIIFEDVQSMNYRNFFMKIWLIFVSLTYLPFIMGISKNFALLVSLFVVGYTLFSIIVWVFGVYYRSVHFCLTDKGIYKISGLINISIIFIPYKKVTDTKLKLGLFERNLNCGSIYINTAGGNENNSSRRMFFYNNFSFNLPYSSSPYEMEITHIKHYQKFMDIISKNV